MDCEELNTPPPALSAVTTEVSASRIPQPPRRAATLRGDLIGGVLASLLSLPLAIGFGVFAYAPLGDEYISLGVLAGLYGTIIAGILASLLGGTPGQISVPTPPLAVMVTSLIAHIEQDPIISRVGTDVGISVCVLLSVALLMAGCFQIVLALLGSGRLIKFIPYPVVAGLINGAALNIFLSQIRPLLGAPRSATLLEIFSGGVSIKWEILLVGFVTIEATLLAQRVRRNLFSPIIGFIVGMLAYFVMGLFADRSLLLPDNPHIIGTIPHLLPAGSHITHLAKIGDYLSIDTIWRLVIPAFTLSVIASTGSLLSSVATETVTHQRYDSVRELLGQGVGNIASAFLGGLPVAGFTPVTRANLEGGGRSRWSSVISCLTVLFAVLAFRWILQWTPMTVIAGVLIVTAGRMIEFESISLSIRKSTVGNLLVILAVMIVTVAIDLIAAVLIGLLITTVFFIREQVNRPILHREYTANLVHSKKVRHQDAMNILEQQGHRIRVYELTGSVFFGTADKLLAEIETHLDSFCMILDLQRVDTLDLTGAHILRQIVDRVHGSGAYLLLSNVDASGSQDTARMRQLMSDTGILAAVGTEYVLPDIDRALERAEDLLLQQRHLAAQTRDTLDLRAQSVFADLTSEQIDKVEQFLEPVAYRASEVIIREGDPGDRIYFILQGSVSVLASLDENDRTRRLTALGEGVFFGDMAILEQRPRSATVRADTDTQLVTMTVNDFNYLIEHEPLIVSKMLLGMTRELSYRLRLTSTELTTLTE